MQRSLSLWFVAFILSLAAGLSPARAGQQQYVVSGHDSFSIGNGDIKSETKYSGSEVLEMSPHGKATRYTARVTYVRNDQGSAYDAKADYVLDLLPSGEQLDSADHDPDYLTVLNQPFSAQLDSATLNDLRRLRKPLPFDFPSPFTQSTLRGHLERIGTGVIGSRKVLGVSFVAGGHMHGALPDRAGLTLVGAIRMNGTAYYDLENALLLALDTTVTISGNVSNRGGTDPITIVYRRTLRAQEAAARSTADRR